METEFGLRQTDINSIKNALARYPEVEKAILYGSRAKGNYKTASDIDLTLIGAALNSKIMNHLEWQIDDLLLPYTFDISIMSQISNPDLIAHIERVGKVIYERILENKENKSYAGQP
jgi:predicted nucleotidyltransferase